MSATTMGLIGSPHSDNGYVKMFRRLWQHPAFRNGQQAAIFAWMVSMAAWRPTTVRSSAGKIDLDAGQLWFSERELAEYFACSRNVIRATVTVLLQERMIVVEKAQSSTRHGTKVTIQNYAEYQSVDADSAEHATQSPPKVHPIRRKSVVLNSEVRPLRREEGKNIYPPLYPPQAGGMGLANGMRSRSARLWSIHRQQPRPRRPRQRGRATSSSCRRG